MLNLLSNQRNANQIDLSLPWIELPQDSFMLFVTIVKGDVSQISLSASLFFVYRRVMFIFNFYFYLFICFWCFKARFLYSLGTVIELALVDQAGLKPTEIHWPLPPKN